MVCQRRERIISVSHLVVFFVEDEARLLVVRHVAAVMILVSPLLRFMGSARASQVPLFSDVEALIE